MGGIPPFNGFQSKELLFESSWHAATHLGGVAWLAPVVAVFGSIFTFAYSFKFISMFFGEKPEKLSHIHKPSIAMILPPLWLMLAVLFVTLAPQTAINTIVNSVIASTALEAHSLHIHLIPHLSPAFGMSLVTMALGAGVFKYYETIHSRIRGLLTSYPYIKSNWWYDNGLVWLTTLSEETTKAVHHNHLRGYAFTALSTISAFTLLGYIATAASLPALGLHITPYIAIVLGVAVVGAFAVTLADSHISGVLTLSILGAMVAIFYILAMAPDLALTQLVVETLSLIIFVLVLDKLPSFYGEIKKSQKFLDVTLSMIVGITVTATVLVSTAASPDKIAHYFVDHAVSDGGGSNIVNVILVDFRGFDTLGEITVVSMAALAVVTLIAMRGQHKWFKDRKVEGKDVEKSVEEASDTEDGVEDRSDEEDEELEEPQTVEAETGETETAEAETEDEDDDEDSGEVIYGGGN